MYVVSETPGELIYVMLVDSFGLIWLIVSFDDSSVKIVSMINKIVGDLT